MNDVRMILEKCENLVSFSITLNGCWKNLHIKPILATSFFTLLLGILFLQSEFTCVFLFANVYIMCLATYKSTCVFVFK